MKATEQIEFKAIEKIVDKFKEFEQKHGWVDYIIAPIIVMIIVLAVYAIKGVYPFGKNTIAYYDMPTQYVQFYSNAWDFLHGKVGLFVTWYFGLGSACAAGLGNFIYFPTNLFLFFTSRDNILYALSFLLLIKMVLSALTMSFYSKRRYGFTAWTICAGILYACSGYVIQYYTNMFFLDYVIIFPMVVWSFERLMIEHKYKMFVLFMFLAFIVNFQLAGMVVIYLLIKGYFMLESIPDEKKGRSLRLFAMSGIIALLISMFSMLPSLIVSLGSSRMDLNNDFNYFNVLKTVYSALKKQKQFMMYGGEVAVGLAALLLLKGKVEVKKYWNHIIMILVLIFPILLEGINLLWHFGSYKHFPIRFGYMLTFELLIFVNEYLNNGNIFENKIIGRIAKLLGTAIIPFVAYILFVFFKQFLHNSITDISSYESYKGYFLTLSAVYFVVFLINENKARNGALILLAIIQAFCGCYGLIAPETGFADGPRIKYLIKSLESRPIFEREGLAKTERIKSDLLDYEPNYSLIIGQPSIGLWAYGIPYDTEKMLRTTMGYHGAQSSIMDEGGTVFSDALLGVTRYLSSHGSDSMLYKSIEGENELYESIYKLPFGIITDKKEINIEDTSFGFHNALFTEITGITDELIQINDAENYSESVTEMTDEYSRKVRNFFVENLPLSNPVDEIKGESEASVSEDTSNSSENNTEENDDDSTESCKEYILSIPIEGKKTVYMDVSDDFAGEMSMKLNGKPMFFSSYLTENSNAYPNTIYTGIISLGSYEDSKIELTIYTFNEDLDGIKIGQLDHDILNKGIKKVEGEQELVVDCGKDKMHVSGKVNKAGTLFFPVGYSKDWKVKVNGERAEVKPYINGAFIAIDVAEGDVDINFTYRAQGLLPGILLSILGIILFFAMGLVIKNGGIAGKKYEKVVDNVIVYGYKALGAAILIVLYVIPIYIRLSL